MLLFGFCVELCLPLVIYLLHVQNGSGVESVGEAKQAV